MANVEYGALVTRAAGSIGGVTFAKTASGQVAKSRPRPPRPHKSLQRTQQSFLSIAAAAWRGLTLVVQDNWVSYAITVTLYNRLGQAFNPTGQQMFIRNAVFQLIYGGSISSTSPPSQTGLPSWPQPTIAASTTDIQLTAWASTPPTDYKCIMRLFGFQSTPTGIRGRRFNQSSFDQTVTLPLTIGSSFLSGLVSGAVVAVPVTYSVMDTYGRVSNPSSINTLITVP